MSDVFLSGNFLRNTRGLTVGDATGVTWAFDKTTNKLTVASLSGASLGAGSVANSNLANMADATVKGRASGGGTGVPQDLTATQVKAILALASTDLSDFTEAVEDVVGGFVGTTATISPTYTDASNTLVFDVRNGSITSTKLDLTMAPTWSGTHTFNKNVLVGAPADLSVSLQVTSPSTNWGVQINGNASAGNSFGLLIKAGTNSSDVGLAVQTAAASALFTVRGDGTVQFGALATTTTAPSAGGAGALPATPKGYASFTINGTVQKVAYY